MPIVAAIAASIAVSIDGRSVFRAGSDSCYPGAMSPSASLYLESWKPNPGWASCVRPAYEQLTAGGIESITAAAWQQLAMMLGDTRGAPLCLLVCLYALDSAPDSHAGSLRAHRDLCLLDLGLAQSNVGESIPIPALGDDETLDRDARSVGAWLIRELEPFAGQIEKAALFCLQLAAIRTQIASGPENPTLEQILDPSLWTPTAAPSARDA